MSNSKRVPKLMLICVLLAACGKQSSPPEKPAAAAPPAPAPAAPAPAAPAPAAGAPDLPAGAGVEVSPGSQQGEFAESFFNPKNYPDAVQGTFIDPQKRTVSERKYGIAPKRDPRVTYQDGVILMEVLQRPDPPSTMTTSDTNRPSAV